MQLARRAATPSQTRPNTTTAHLKNGVGAAPGQREAPPLGHHPERATAKQRSVGHAGAVVAARRPAPACGGGGIGRKGTLGPQRPQGIAHTACLPPLLLFQKLTIRCSVGMRARWCQLTLPARGERVLNDVGDGHSGVWHTEHNVCRQPRLGASRARLLAGRQGRDKRGSNRMRARFGWVCLVVGSRLRACISPALPHAQAPPCAHAGGDERMPAQHHSRQQQAAAPTVTSARLGTCAPAALHYTARRTLLAMQICPMARDMRIGGLNEAPVQLSVAFSGLNAKLTGSVLFAAWPNASVTVTTTSPGGLVGRGLGW